MKFHIVDNSGNVVLSSLGDTCRECYRQCNSTGIKVRCPQSMYDSRNGKQKSSKGVFFLCCDLKEAKTTKLFRSKLDLLIYSIPTFEKIKEKVTSEIVLSEQAKYQRIVHNLKTINAQSIQEQFALIPQDILAENHNDQLYFVKSIIDNDTEKAAKTFLRLAKNNSDIKTEFVTHEKLSIESPNLSFNRHNVRKVILNVFHAFSLEFRIRNIWLRIFSEDYYLMFDYDTIRVSFYHMFHNCSKYVKPKSTLEVLVVDEATTTTIVFKMTSIHIEEEEIEKIFNDNYSGVRVKQKNKQGAGLGMGLMKNALKLNNAEIKILPGTSINTLGKVDYSENEFHFIFDKKNRNRREK